MPSQLFKQIVPIDILFNFLNEICEIEHNYYKFNSDAYKRAVLKDSISSFLETIKPCYHQAKQHYLERKVNYNNFVTIIRQLCNLHSIGYTSKINYSKSKYEIIYYINTRSQITT